MPCGRMARAFSRPVRSRQPSGGGLYYFKFMDGLAAVRARGCVRFGAGGGGALQQGWGAGFYPVWRQQAANEAVAAAVEIAAKAQRFIQSGQSACFVPQLAQAAV